MTQAAYYKRFTGAEKAGHDMPAGCYGSGQYTKFVLTERCKPA